MSSRVPSTLLVFSIQGDDLLVNINPSNKTAENFDGTILKLLPQSSFAVKIGNRRPIEVLTELRDKLSSIVLFNGNESFDSVVRDIAQNFNTGNVRDTTLRKAYAKYFYETFTKRNSTALTRDGGIKETGLIVTELLSWYFIRRAVHIYVVCAILDRVNRATEQSISVSGQSTPPVFTTTISEDTKNKIANLEKKVIDMTGQLSQSQLAPAQISMLQSQLEEFKKEMIDKEVQLKKCQDHNNQLAQELANFKELLLSSTSMIFKMEEIPNLAS